MQYAVAVNSSAELAVLAAANPAWCAAVEVAGDLFCDYGFAAAFQPLRGKELIIRDLMPRSYCEFIPSESGAIRREFISEFHRVCRKAAAANVVKVGLPFPVSAHSDTALSELLRALFGVLYDTKLAPHFTMRVPRVPGTPEYAEALAFLRRLMFPAFVTLDLHVHEPAYAAADPGKLFCGDLGPFSDLARVGYEPGLGNQLSTHVVHRIAAGENPYALRRTLIFAPANCPTAVFENELQHLTSLLNEEDFSSC